jgi:hypothetical protein
MSISNIGRSTPILPVQRSAPVANSFGDNHLSLTAAAIAKAGGVPSPYSVAGADPQGYARLTPSDLALFASMYGPDALRTGFDKNGNEIGVPAFVADTMADRQSGHLAPGQEITAGFVQGVWDMYAAHSNPGDRTPLSARELADALDFFKRKDSKVDLRA